MSNKKLKTIGIDLGGESRTLAQLVDDNNKVVYNYVIPSELISDGKDIDLRHIADAMIYGLGIRNDNGRVRYSEFYKDQSFLPSPMHPARPHDPPPQSDRAAFSA